MSPKQAWRRLSRRNEGGAQGAVFAIAIGAWEADLTVVARRVDGSSVFRSNDDGRSWQCVSDVLNREEPATEFFCVAVRPGLPDVIFLGTTTGLRVSINGGVSWPTHTSPGGKLLSLLIDEAASGSSWGATTLYAGTDQGVAISTDGGLTWQLDAIGPVTSLAAYMPRTGSRRFYAGVIGPGLMYAETVGTGVAAWRTLTGPGGEAGLPADPLPGYTMTALVDIHPRHPDRVYALIVNTQPVILSGSRVQGLFVSVSESTASGRRVRTWEERALSREGRAPTDPDPKPGIDTRLDGSSLFVAPEYAGPDTDDVLICTGPIWPWRATQGGRLYQYMSGGGAISHTDTRSLAIYPPATAFYDGMPAGVAHPRVYFGSDGGLVASRRLTDPVYDVTAWPPGPAYYNERGFVDPANGAPENLSHGLAAVAGFQLGHAGDPRGTDALSTAGYLSTLDTGTSRLLTSRVAREVGGGDAGPTFAARTPTGVRLWQNASMGLGWVAFPTWNFITYVDTDGSGPSGLAQVMTTGGQPTGATSNPLPDTPGQFFTGIITRETYCTITNASPAADPPRPVEFMISAIAPGGDPLRAGDYVMIGPDPNTGEEVHISAVTTGSFTARSAAAHRAGEPVFSRRYGAARVAGTTATRLGQSSSLPDRRPARLARGGDYLYAASADQRLWRLQLSTVTPDTPWIELPGRPAGLAARVRNDYDGLFYSGVEHQPVAPIIATLITAADGAVYALLSGAVAAIAGGPVSALWRIDSGAWAIESCTPPVAAVTIEGGAGGAAAAHPDAADVLYWSRFHRLYEVRRTGAVWNWTDITEDLPGQEIHDLHLVNLARPGEAPRYMLRALVALRGVWEREVAGPARGPHLFYFRKHVFNRGWTGPVADGLENPFRPGEFAWHWQSPDIKVDAPERDDAGALFYQTDPESPRPKPGEFAWILDRSDTAPAGEPLRVFVQVSNRSRVRSGEVRVWAISCLWAGALPTLPATASGADFWTRFHADGTLDHSLPAGGRWISLTPRTTTPMATFPVSGVTSEAPAVAGFDLIASSPDDHRCVLAFVHGPDAVINGAGRSLSPDEAVLVDPQIAQRNISIGAALPAAASAPGEVPAGDRSSTTGPGGTGAREISRTIDFHNSSAAAVATTIRFAGQNLPRSLGLAVRLSTNARPAHISGGAPRPVHQKIFLQLILAWLRQLLRKLLGWRESPASPAGRLPLSAQWIDAKPQSNLELHDIALPPGGHIRAEFVVRTLGDLPPGSRHQLDILQLVKGRVIGGATLYLPITGESLTFAFPEVDKNERENAARFRSRQVFP